MRRALGIDPGLATTGWGIVEADGDKRRFVDCGIIKTEKGASQSVRLLHLWQKLRMSEIDHYEIDEAGIENVYVGAGRHSSVKTAEAVGVIKVWLAYNGFTVSEFQPASIKKQIAGSGRAGKPQMKAAVRAELIQGGNGEYLDIDEHEADALAVALMVLR